MGISTTGFVLTEDKDIFAVLNTIEDTLKEKYFEEKCFPKIECNSSGKYFSIFFKINNENRMLMVHFDCDGDYKEYGDSKIIWSLNCWGLAEDIVLAICEKMKRFGRVFYEAKNCDDLIVEV